MEVPDLDVEDIWDYPFTQLVATRDRLIHFKILHMPYFTPQRLHPIFKCWRCGETRLQFFFNVFLPCSYILGWCPTVYLLSNHNFHSSSGGCLSIGFDQPSSLFQGLQNYLPRQPPTHDTSDWFSQSSIVSSTNKSVVTRRGNATLW